MFFGQIAHGGFAHALHSAMWVALAFLAAVTVLSFGLPRWARDNELVPAGAPGASGDHPGGGGRGSLTPQGRQPWPPSLGYCALEVVLGLDHVQVAAPSGCEPAARRFYGELLGMTELAKPAALQARGGAWFACGAHQLHVGIHESFAPATKAHPALRVSATEFDALAARLRAAGHEVSWTKRFRARGASTPPTRGATGSSSWPPVEPQSADRGLRFREP